MNELNREMFEAWLFSQPGDRVIESAHTGRCFICSFVKETSGLTKLFPNLEMDWEHAYLGERGEDIRPLPQWVTRLIERSWCVNNQTSFWGGITVAVMQRRYIKLFGPVDLRDGSGESTAGTNEPDNAASPSQAGGIALEVAANDKP